MALFRDQDKSFIIFHRNHFPRVFKINSKTLSTFILLAPFLAISLLVASYALIKYYQNRFINLKNSQNTQLIELEEQFSAAKSDLANLQKENDVLRAKNVAVPSSQNKLNLFSTILGYKDLTANNFTKIESVVNKINDDHIAMSYQVANNMGGSQKLGGYAFTIQIAGSQLNICPALEKSTEAFLNYFNGNSFTVNRFKTIECQFPKVAGAKQYLYRVIIFSKTGDLIFQKELGPLNAEAQ